MKYFCGFDLWVPPSQSHARRTDAALSLNYRCPPSRRPMPTYVRHPRPLLRQVARRLPRDVAARRAARSKREFLEEQVRKIEAAGGRSDSDWWLTWSEEEQSGEFVCWMKGGHLMVCLVRHQRSPLYRDFAEDEWKLLRVADRPILTAEPGETPANAVRLALERLKPPTESTEGLPTSREARADTKRRGRNTRYRPEGNIVTLRRPRREEELPDYALVTVPGAPPAFESRWKARRWWGKRRRAQLLEHDEELIIARVIKVFTVSIDAPRLRNRSPEQVLDVLDDRPQLGAQALRVRYLPRFERVEDGSWRPERPRTSRRVLKGEPYRQRLIPTVQVIANTLAQSKDEVDQLDALFDEEEQALQASFLIQHGRARRSAQRIRKLCSLTEQIQSKGTCPLPTLARIRRLLPPSWQQAMGVSLGQEITTYPFFPKLASGLVTNPGIAREQRYVRIPWNNGEEVRTIELEIPDLREMISWGGFEAVFLLIREKPGRNLPRIVMPVEWAQVAAAEAG